MPRSQKYDRERDAKDWLVQSIIETKLNIYIKSKEMIHKIACRSKVPYEMIMSQNINIKI